MQASVRPSAALGVPQWLAGLPPDIALRREEAGDRAFAGQLYAANRMAELALTGWPMQAKADFLRDQFEAQSRHLRSAWPRADRFTLIDRATRSPIGRLYVSRRSAAWHLIEIGLLPQVQRRGIGSALVRALQTAAAGAGAGLLDLEVARDNPRAAALYERLGFVDAATASVTHRTMVWRIG
jgi:RimJ/RimL family protein N-acetyltransferase